MNRKILTVILSLIMVLELGVQVFADDNKEKVIVVEENVKLCKDYDITNYELENYLNSIEDLEKRELLKKYFYLPAERDSSSKASHDILSEAKYIASIPKQELVVLVKQIEDNIPKVLENQKLKYKDELVKLNRVMLASRGLPGKYSYTLKASLPSKTGEDAVWIKVKVYWHVNDDNEVYYIAPKTSTGKTSYYRWLGDIYGTQYVEDSKGYVKKERSFTIKTQDQDDPYWTIWCEGKFGVGSIPESSDGGWKLVQ